MLLWGFGLLGAALLLLVLEVFIPSGGVIGVLSLVSAIAGVVMFWRVSWVWGTISTMLVLVLGPMAFSFALRVMPHTPFGRQLFLTETDEQIAERRRRLADERQAEQALVGAEGRALTDLRPVGVADLEGTRVEVLAVGGPIDAGGPVRVVEVEGSQVRVRRVRA